MTELFRADSEDPRQFFLHYLLQLSGLVERAVACGESSGNGGDALMDARLAPDMFSFSQQVSTAAGFSLRALLPLAGLEVPKLVQVQSGAELLELIRWVSGVVEEIPKEKLQGFESREINTAAGFAEQCFSGWEYLQFYTIPNFLFHLSMAYGILRSHGVPLGKADFDGFHAYPPGFRFSG
ncbi:DUF1993 family protein [Microbulbifer donghaiensis]|uniref:DUF1993 family protein n=1 Tax=Microbulbifer donghaiensis TaxID=494016 RepID=UPI001356423A|nr:DUF1993 domain-containing protein [Microbulbifer donghaiensis]